MWILEEVAEAGYLSPKAVFIDGTHIKANANTKKQVKAAIPAESKHYAKELMGGGKCRPGSPWEEAFR